LLASSAVLITTGAAGAGGGIGVAAGSLLVKTGAGSRTVERRRVGAVSTAGCGAGAAVTGCGAGSGCGAIRGVYAGSLESAVVVSRGGAQSR
jgi:hypothetical protein